MPYAIVAVLSWLAQKLFIVFIVQLALSLGMAFITYKGFEIGIQYLKDGVLNTIGQLPEAAYNLLMLAGVGEGLGYLFGALSFYAAMKATSRLRFAFWGN
ncbi:DUF2523 domain-containing protein [Neisseria weixii]|uniref:DUF2523 domain-containing protein n=1 Tax=Neisseria weixii TaxID=1853276 RepID=A0A3N4MHT4_9NEIS|nr:DUF2523 family protein [Neisseria weixii]RPD83061.1 DUF2523 domain-containing protein [Neisseria weixii]RPD85608.1 DUF2523 domain-containing protein [Neisseria weixii]